MYMPYAPLEVPKPVVPDRLWIVDGPEIRMRVLGLGLPFPTRMTLLRHAGGGIWVHSPTGGAAAMAGVAALGPVRCLVAPNTLHHAWLGAWARRFPDAAVWIVPGLERLAARQGIRIAGVLGETAPAAWDGEIELCLVRGSVLTEACFFHVATRTLVLTDLIENFEPGRVEGRCFRCLLCLSGATDPDGKAPVDMRLSFLPQRRALRAAVQRMLAWAPERVILAHGRWYDRDGTAQLRRAFRWVL